MSDIERKVGEDIIAARQQEAQSAHEQDIQIALDKGQHFNGKPWIRVVVDGGWLKESRGHSYSSTSGWYL